MLGLVVCLRGIVEDDRTSSNLPFSKKPLLQVASVWIKAYAPKRPALQEQLQASGAEGCAARMH